MRRQQASSVRGEGSVGWWSREWNKHTSLFSPLLSIVVVQSIVMLMLCIFFFHTLLLLLLLRMENADDIREMNGHSAVDDEIKRQRLHYSSDQLYSVSSNSACNWFVIRLFSNFNWILCLCVDVAHKVEHRFKGRQTFAGYWQCGRWWSVTNWRQWRPSTRLIALLVAQFRVRSSTTTTATAAAERAGQ